jgi:hypothetical protein
MSKQRRETPPSKSKVILHLGKVPQDPKEWEKFALALFKDITGRDATPEEIQELRDEIALDAEPMRDGLVKPDDKE